MEQIIVKGISNPNVWSIVLFVLYILYNEYNKRQINIKNRSDSKLELYKKDAVDAYKVKLNNKEECFNEIRRYTLNKFKHYKANIMADVNFDAECINGLEQRCTRADREGAVRLAAHGVLLKALIKLEDDVMVHIIENGYTQLSTVELEEYISYIANNIYDTFVNRLEPTEHIVPLKIYVKRDDLKSMMRIIFETAINIKSRKDVK